MEGGEQRREERRETKVTNVLNVNIFQSSFPSVFFSPFFISFVRIYAYNTLGPLYHTLVTCITLKKKKKKLSYSAYINAIPYTVFYTI